MEEARVNIDPFKSVEEQVKETVRALRPLLPIRFEEIRIAVRIPGIRAAEAPAATLSRTSGRRMVLDRCARPGGLQRSSYSGRRSRREMRRPGFSGASRE